MKWSTIEVVVTGDAAITIDKIAGHKVRKRLRLLLEDLDTILSDAPGDGDT